MPEHEKESGKHRDPLGRRRSSFSKADPEILGRKLSDVARKSDKNDQKSQEK